MKIQWSCQRLNFRNFNALSIVAKAQGFVETFEISERDMSSLQNYEPLFKRIETKLRKTVEFSLAVDHLRSAVDSQMRYQQITGRNAECVALPLETAKTLLEMLK